VSDQVSATATEVQIVVLVSVQISLASAVSNHGGIDQWGSAGVFFCILGKQYKVTHFSP
jgi:hypothetical protein